MEGSADARTAWSIYAQVYRYCSVGARVTHEPTARWFKDVLDSLRNVSILHIPWQQVLALPRASTYADEVQNLRDAHPPFPLMLLTCGGEVSFDTEIGWFDTPIYACLIAGPLPINNFLPTRDLRRMRQVWASGDRTATDPPTETETDLAGVTEVVGAIPFWWTPKHRRPGAMGHALLPLGAKEGCGVVTISNAPHTPIPQDDPGSRYYKTAWDEASAASGAGALMGIRALGLLESENVDIVPTAPAFKGHRAAGLPCYEVVIRQSRRPSRHTEDHPDWSHRWEVRGHYKHFGPETRLYRSVEQRRPEKIVDDRTFGRCVRVWCPPFVKGPENKPLIRKTRLWRR